MLNWLTRYAFVAAELSFDQAGGLRESVLDVGCGPHGLSIVAPSAGFAGVDVLFPDVIAPSMVGFRSEPGPLPFADGAFETVVCLDVLEHVPRIDRASFVAELTRVAARRVLIACPSSEGRWIDDLVRGMYAQRGLAAPVWLDEHDEHGEPTPDEIAEFCSAPSGFQARELQMTNGLLSTLAVVADMLPELADRAAAEFRDEREGWLELFGTARFGDCFRKGYAIERVEAREALVESGDLPGSAVAAACCPGCGRFELRLQANEIRCGGCARAITRDTSGAVDLTRTPEDLAPRLGAQLDPAPSPAELPDSAGVSSGSRVPPHPVATPAPVLDSTPCGPIKPSARASAESTRLRLLLTPDWERPAQWLPALAHYIARADADGSTLMCVDASRAAIPASVIAEMLGLACETLAPDRAFADVTVLDGPPAETGIVAVRGSADVDRALGAAPQSTPIRPEQAADHAIRVKRLTDAMRACVERWRYANAPDPWMRRDPLVSVRIPTWNGHGVLVQRTIPSVLNGSYRNLEVVVCSDGPDTEARAAVEGIGDDRVRYVELNERPAYAQHRWSFWRTAGVHAANLALDECRGAFIAPLDHDDAFTFNHVHHLLAAAAASQSDMVYGQALMETANGSWHTVGATPLQCGHITHGSVLYSQRLAHQRMDADCWLLDEPADWNMWRRFTELDIPVSFLPEVLLLHHRERAAVGAAHQVITEAEMTPTPEDIVADVRHTGLQWMLDVPLPVPIPA